MTAKITFRLPQAHFDIYDASLFAYLTGERCYAKRDLWLFQVELADMDAEDSIDADSQAWAHWTDVIRPDVAKRFGEAVAELIEEDWMTITVSLSIEEQENEAQSLAA